MKIVLLTNILTPYRQFLYKKIYEIGRTKEIELNVLVMSDTEPNRKWFYDDFKEDFTVLLKNRSINIGNIFIHFNSNLKKTLANLKPDIVICSGSYFEPSVRKALRLRNKLGYKTLFWSESHLDEIHNNSLVKNLLRETLRKKTLKKFDGFVYAGKKSKEFLMKYEREKKFLYLPNLIDNKKFGNTVPNNVIREEVLKENKCEIDTKILFSPVRLSPEKGIIEFIEVLNSINPNKYLYLIAGDGPLKQKILDTCQANGNNHIKLLGYKSEEEMLKLYSIADIFVLPSLSDPNPLSVIEACWCGLPLVVSNHVGNYPELVKAGENGFVFGDFCEAKRVINGILSKDQSWFEQAKKMSLEIASSKYEPSIVVNSFLDELLNL